MKYTPQLPQTQALALSPAELELRHTRPAFQLGLVLDASGSISHLIPSLCAGYNLLVGDHPESEITTTFFGHEVTFAGHSVPAHEVAQLTPKTYPGLGSTALLDGMGATIHSIGAVYDPPIKRCKPAVLVALLTDGEENSSKKFTLEDIRAMVTYRRVACRWQFVYLTSADTAYGMQLGIPSSHIASFTADPADLRNLLERVRKAVGAFILGDPRWQRLLLKEGAR